MSYPLLRADAPRDELRDSFTIDASDRAFLKQARKDSSRLGFAVLLKTFLALGYPPRRKSEIPAIVVEWLAGQLGVAPKMFRRYRWRDSLWDHHLSAIRQHSGFRPFESKGEDPLDLQMWLAERGNELPSRKALLVAAVQRCRECRLELPSERELGRLVNTARRRFFQDLYAGIFERIEPAMRERMLACLVPQESGTTSYDWMKSTPGKMGMKTLREELRRLEFIRSFGIDRQRQCPGTSPKLLRQLRARAGTEDAALMRRHPPAVRFTLLAALLHGRQMEVTDDIVRILLELIRRIDKKADREIEKQLIRDIKKVFGKTEILYRIAEVATENPDQTVREVLFPAVGEDVLRRIVEESRQTDTQIGTLHSRVAQRKYRSHYRQMLKPVLAALSFRCDNPAQRPLLDGLELVNRYANSKRAHYPDDEKIPEQLLTQAQRALVFEQCPDGEKAARHPFELCVLRKLERALKCKELWVEGAYRFRNPDEDLPADWPTTRIEHYRQQGFALDATSFLEPIRAEMRDALEGFHRFLGRPNRDVHVRHPGGGPKGFFHIPRLEKRPERPVLQELKGRVLQRWGILDFLDILVEADRQVQFSRFFQTSGQRQILSRQEIRMRLLLTLFSLGTNLGLSRIHSAAKPSCSYDDLRYFCRRFVTPHALREVNAALVNRILEVRNPRIWGNGTVCASDGKHLGAWDQNLVAEWSPHYRKRGVMAYWHLETNATCIYSQIEKASEVAAMIEGLVRHDTEMRLESNFVDSHGQSEIAFAFCRFLGIELLPRLKRLKYQKLHLPAKEQAENFSRFEGVLARPTKPIRWDLIEEQYDEIVRHVVAVRQGTGPIDSILRRFNSYNRSHPTYRALTELGKADKTIFLCRVLSRPELRQEINEGLNVVENWNSVIHFICFGRRTELQTNDPQMQEQVVLSLHLLQNALILANTLMLESVLDEDRFAGRMEPEDYRALTPLFTSNVNPYGDFTLDFDKPSFLEKAA